MPLPAALLEIADRVHAIEAREDAERSSGALPLRFPALDAVLPDGGLPLGVTEIASPHARSTTSIGLSAVASAHAKDARAWCGWVMAGEQLYAPGLLQAGVDLERLLVVRPLTKDAAKVSVRVASSGAFDVIVIDAFAFAQSLENRAFRRSGISPEVFVRKLSLLASEHGARVVLLTDSSAHRAMPWPVALRLEVERERAELLVRVAKDRHGRMSVKKTRIPLEPSAMTAAG